MLISTQEATAEATKAPVSRVKATGAWVNVTATLQASAVAPAHRTCGLAPVTGEEAKIIMVAAAAALVLAMGVAAPGVRTTIGQA